MTNNNLNLKKKSVLIQNIKQILQEINVPENGINAIIKNKKNNDIQTLTKYYNSLQDKWQFYLKTVKKKELVKNNNIQNQPQILNSTPKHNTISFYNKIIFEIREKKKCNIKKNSRKSCNTFEEVKKSDGDININKSKKKCENQNCCWDITNNDTIPKCYNKKKIESSNNLQSNLNIKVLLEKILDGDYKKILTANDSKNGSINADINNIKKEYNINKKNIIKFIKDNYPKIYDKLNKYFQTIKKGGKNIRLSPKKTAKKYKLNKKMKGLDGNYWIVKERKDKIKYWKKI